MSSDGRARGVPVKRHQTRLPTSLSRTAVSLVLILTFVGAVVAWRGQSSHALDRNRVLAQRGAAALETIMRATGESLLGAQSLGANGVVEHSEFVAFASGVISDSEFTALFYLPIFGDSQRAAFEKRYAVKIKDRAAGLKAGQFTIAPRRAEYAPIADVWPRTATTPQSIGFDYLGDPQRGPAVTAARIAGAPRASAPLLTAQTNKIGITITVPVYEGYVKASVTAAPTRTMLVGFIGGTIFAQALGDKVSALIPDSTSLRIVDGNDLIFASKRPFKGDGATTMVDILGRHLSVSTDSSAGTSLTWPALILLAGLSVAGFTARTFAVSASRNAAVAKENEELDRAHRSTSTMQELTARLATSSSSADMAEALTSHLRAHEPNLLGSGVVMLLDAATGRREDCIDRLPAAIVDAVSGEAETQLSMAAFAGRASFGGAELDGFGLDPGCLAVLPLTRGGVTVAMLVLAFIKPQRFDAEQRLRLTTVSAIGSQSLERALRYDEEHAMATSLQRSLLPHVLPAIDGLQLAVRYIPATETALVGGDWYDAFAVASGLAFVVGDAVGHGVEAASAMGQIRSATRVAMLAGEGPAAALEVLDAFVGSVPGASDATALVAVVDVDTKMLRISRAGHIPPLLVREGQATYIEEGGSLPLGWPDHSRPLAEFALRPGDVIISLTDGVVERRTGSLQDQLDEMAAVCKQAVATLVDLDAMCDLILHRMDAERPSDDVALLLVRYSG